MAYGESRRWACWLVLVLGLVLGPSVARGQLGTRLDLGGSILANGEELRYLRSLSLLDSLRDASPLVLPNGTTGDRRWRAVVSRQENPWRARFDAPPLARLGGARGLDFRILRPDAQVVYHSALAAPLEGVAWAGRGGTVVAQGGVAAQWRGVRLQVAPIVFHAENRAFEIAPTGYDGPLAFADPRYPGNIDLPQRFGDEAYGRFDWGDSFIDLTALGFTAGLSNARQHWGPAREYPLVLGTSSGGFAHAFAGTAAPLNVGLGRLQLRLMAGRLEQSMYSNVQTGETARSLVGFIGSFSPAFLPGFEVGGIRVANGRWPSGGLQWGDVSRVFAGIISDNTGTINQGDNQFASVFLRIAPPQTGFEVYGELSREDFAGNLRWLVMQPDDLMDYVVGIAQTRVTAPGRMDVLRVELVNGETSHQERIGRVPFIARPPYTHSGTNQGLTNRGQLLGSPEAYGGGGGIITWERYTSDGRVTLSGSRAMVLDWLPTLGAAVPYSEVRYGIRGDLVRFRGGAEWGVSVAPSLILNRNLERGRDVFDLAVGLRWRGW